MWYDIIIVCVCQQNVQAEVVVDDNADGSTEEVGTQPEDGTNGGASVPSWRLPLDPDGRWRTPSPDGDGRYNI